MDRPNIVFIMADDHAPHALGCYGGTRNHTPHLDRLAGEGVRCTHAFDTTALCAPSRAALLSGRYAHLNGFYRNRDTFDRSQLTFPTCLQEAGYATSIFGKWHLTTQPAGFDHYDVLPGHGRFWNPRLKTSGQTWLDGDEGGVETEGYLTELITDRALAWMEQRDARQPFCTLIHHKAPHAPHEYPKCFGQRYTEDLPLPETFEDDWQGREALRLSQARWSKLENMLEYDLTGDERAGKPIPPREDRPAFRRWAYQTFFKGYFRLVASLDESVGRVLEGLERLGVADNTLVVYTSDNGFFLGEHGLYNKMWMYEEALRLPFLARWPGRIAPGSVCDSFVSLLDVGPTFCEAAGAKEPEAFQGKSLLEVLAGKPGARVREAHYYHYYGEYDVPSHCGLRTREAKILCHYEQPPQQRWELYDLQVDPGEMHNLAGRAESRDCFEQLQAQLRETAAGYADPVAQKL
ncbi:MAG: sulfatase [Opitutales bacterium]